MIIYSPLMPLESREVRWSLLNISGDSQNKQLKHSPKQLRETGKQKTKQKTKQKIVMESDQASLLNFGTWVRSLITKGCEDTSIRINVSIWWLTIQFASMQSENLDSYRHHRYDMPLFWNFHGTSVSPFQSMCSSFRKNIALFFV